MTRRRCSTCDSSSACVRLCLAQSLDDCADERVRLLESTGLRAGSDDVLDTWFSSALWPHSTLGWPEQTEELKYYYPTNVLITSRDIITLWVARMVLMGLHNVGEGAVPRGLHPSEDSRRLRRGDVEIEGQRRRSDRRDREVRGRLAPLRPGLSDHRDARRADAGRVRVPPLREADRADQRKPRPAADQVQALRQKSFRRNGPRSRRTRHCRAARSSASGSSLPAISATNSGTPRGSR